MAALPISMPNELPAEIKAVIDRWFSNAERWVHEFGFENENFACDRIVHTAVVGRHAYVVLSATLPFKLKGGQSGSTSGILTFTFAKQGNKWKLEAQSWAASFGHPLPSRRMT